MATDSHVKSVTNTLTSTTADEITLTQLWPVVRITNHSTSTWLYARQDGVAVAEADGTTAIAPNTTRAVKGERAEGTNTIVVSVVGDGNTYTVEGVNGGDIDIAELQADVEALNNATIQSVFVPAIEMGLANGAAALSAATGPYPYWQFDPAAFEAVDGMVVLPSAWTAYDVDIYWTNVSSTSGDVDWEFFPAVNALADGADITSHGSALPSSGVAAAPTTANIVEVTTLAASVAISGQRIGFKIARRGSDANDTLVNDVRLMGVEFRNAS